MSEKAFGATYSRGAALFIFFMTIAIAMGLVALWLLPGRPLEQAAALCTIALAMWLVARNFMPPHVTQMLTEVRALAVPLAIIGCTAGSVPALIVLGWSALRPYIPSLPDPPAVPGLWENVVLLGIGCLFALAFTRLRTHRSAMGPLPTDWHSVFPEPNFTERLENLALQLRLSLDLLDGESSWSPVNFIPLEAEVEIVRQAGRKLEVAELYRALELSGDSRLFLLLGDPGSGKSVALRNLARNMLYHVRSDRRLPVYINLKEWRREGDLPWTPNNPPTANELKIFILDSLRRRIPPQSHEFLDTYFDALIQKGRLFLLLDSFDEIPALMDAEDPRWLVDALSESVAQILTSGRDARGLVASRLFRRPNPLRAAYCRLDIRPFSEGKALALIDRLAGTESTGNAVRNWVLARRPDLAVAARNPFLLGLLVDFAKRHPGKEPPNQYALYESFMQHSISAALRDPDYRGLSETEIWTVTERVAFLMFETERFGLEMPLEKLEAVLPNLPVGRVTRFLQHARLARFGLNSSLFSFTHRRFNEFFLVRWFLEDPERVWRSTSTFLQKAARPPISSIADDGRWRDALVLYAQVAPVREAQRIAAHCVMLLHAWKTAAEPDGAAYMQGLHALRFLSDSFGPRDKVLAPLQQELEDRIHIGVASDDILVQKHAVEALGVVEPNKAALLLEKALNSGSFWVRETAFRACRYLPSMPTSIIELMRSFIFSIPAYELRKQRQELTTLFNVVEAFRPLRSTLVSRSWEAVIGPIGLLLLLVMWTNLVLAAVGLRWIAANLSQRDKAFANRGHSLSARKSLSIGQYDYWSIRGYLYIILKFFLIVSVTLPAFKFILDAFKNWRIDFDSYLRLIADLIVPLVVWFSPLFAIIRSSEIFQDPSKEILVSIIMFISLALSTVLIIPYHSSFLSIVLFVQSFSMHRSANIIYTSTVKLAKRARSMITTFLLFSAIFYLFITLIEFLGETAKYIVMAMLFALPLIVVLTLCWIIFSSAIGTLRMAGRDHRVLRRLGTALPATRSEIAVNFLALKTARGRLNYVSRLEMHANEIATEMADPNNRWPNGRRPNIDHDEASSRLARLDERWLDLNR